MQERTNKSLCQIKTFCWQLFAPRPKLKGLYKVLKILISIMINWWHNIKNWKKKSAHCWPNTAVIHLLLDSKQLAEVMTFEKVLNYIVGQTISFLERNAQTFWDMILNTRTSWSWGHVFPLEVVLWAYVVFSGTFCCKKWKYFFLVEWFMPKVNAL